VSQQVVVRFALQFSEEYDGLLVLQQISLVTMLFVRPLSRGAGAVSVLHVGSQNITPKNQHSDQSSKGNTQEIALKRGSPVLPLQNFDRDNA
jgi:hypothetical protein